MRVTRVLLALVALSILLTPLRRELYVGDETKYSQVVREMRAGGAILLPTLHGTPFTHKPPVHFWMIAALTHVLGVYSVWPYVIPSILAFWALLAIVRKMANEHDPLPNGEVVAFVCATSLMIWGSAQSARMDLSFTALITLAATFIWRFFEMKDSRALLIAAVTLAVAALIKGPMAPVIGLTLFGFEAWSRRSLPRGNYFAAIAALVVIPLLWVVPAVVSGGEAFAHEIFVKQTAGRAVGAWVHRSPPWFYLVRSPATLFPWFFLFIAALVALYRRDRDDRFGRFCVRWVLAVFVPYTLLSSKLDVYMMTLLPPVALIAGRFITSGDDDRFAVWGRRLNTMMMALLLAIGLTGFFAAARLVRPADRELAALPEVRALFVVLAIAAIIGLIVVARTRSLLASSLSLGLIPICALVYVGTALVPLANEMASTRPLVRALVRQNVPGDQIALFTCPQLWTRDMPPSLERVQYSDAETFRDPRFQPRVIATSRRYAKDIAPALASYRKVDEVRMIGKWFDVYRR